MPRTQSRLTMLFLAAVFAAAPAIRAQEKPDDALAAMKKFDSALKLYTQGQYDQAAKLLGQDDIFSKALIESQLKNIDQQMDTVLAAGIPEESRAYMGMMGFRVKINVHGEVIDFQQPGIIDSSEE